MHKLTTVRPLILANPAVVDLPGAFGVEHDDWYAQARRFGDEVTISMTARHPRRAVELLAASDDPIDRWFKEQLRALTGADVVDVFGPRVGGTTERAETGPTPGRSLTASSKASFGTYRAQ